MKHIITVLFLLWSSALGAQKSDADKHYRLFEYARAIPFYEKYVANNGNDYEALAHLADCYKLTNAVDNAAGTYAKMVSLPQSNPQDLYELVQLYRILQRQSDAARYATQYAQKAPGERADVLQRSIENYGEYKKSEHDDIITDKTGSHTFSVLTAYPLSSQIIVTAENRSGKGNKWTGRSFTDLYATDASFTTLTPFAEGIMTKFDDGIPTFTADGSTMYFTSVNKATIREDNIDTRKLHILMSTLGADAGWTEAKGFPYNNNAYSLAHPTLSLDGSMLVFSSDMPGGKGGMDLYYCTSAGNSWSAPHAIDALNTWGNEIFPVFQNNGTLMFSSNGWPGMGGLDILESKVSGSSFSAPRNVAAPLNSSYDDYCLISRDGLQSGYLSSNRFGSMSIDHILYFNKAGAIAETPSSSATSLKILVKDKYTGIPLPYASVSVKDASGAVQHKGLTDESGVVIIEELPRGAYAIQGTLNDVTTTIAKVAESDFSVGVKVITRELTHNDPRFTMKGIVVNTRTGKPVEGVVVTCQNTSLNLTRKVTTGADGSFFFQLEQKSNYKVSGEKKGWLSSQVAEETTMGLDRSAQLYVKLTLNLEQPSSNAVIRLANIRYDYDKCDINPKAATELNRLVTLMSDYPDMTIELGSHTDARGSDEYNAKLSQCRADAAVKYLLSKGIATYRMSAKGYGETKPLNRCTNGISCAEAEHQENRRTDFTIVSCSSCPR